MDASIQTDNSVLYPVNEMNNPVENIQADANLETETRETPQTVIYQRLQEFLDTYPDYYSAFENWLNNNSTSPRSPLTSPICPNVGVQTSPSNMVDASTAIDTQWSDNTVQTSPIATNSANIQTSPINSSQDNLVLELKNKIKELELSL